MINCDVVKKYSISVMLFIQISVGCLAGGGTNNRSDTAVSYPSIDLMLAVLKNQSAFSQGRLVQIVDSLMDMDTVPYSYYNSLISCFAKEVESNPYKESDGQEYPGSEFYATWDNKNFYNTTDLLKCDTVITISLFDSIHRQYVHPYAGVVTSKYGWRGNAMHNGIDIDLNKGDKVVAAFDGVVRLALRHAGYGNVVVIRHYNGLETTYAHLSKIKVKVGQELTAGSVVGLGGSTGKSTGSHLHFEIRFKGLAINPSSIISFKNFEVICSDEITIRKNKWGIYAYPRDAKFYTIQKGDTLFTIAKKYGVTTTYLRELNGFSKKQYLKVGYKLRIA